MALSCYDAYEPQKWSTWQAIPKSARVTRILWKEKKNNQQIGLKAWAKEIFPGSIKFWGLHFPKNSII